MKNYFRKPANKLRGFLRNFGSRDVQSQDSKIFPLLFFFILLSLPVFAGWTELTSGTTQNLTSVYFLNSSLGFATGAGGTLLRTTDGGQTWTAKGVASLTATYNDVFFPSASEGYVMTGPGAFIKSSNAEGDFSSESLTITVDGTIYSPVFKKGSALGTRRAFAASNGSTANSYLRLSSDSGSSWALTALTSFDVAGVLLGPGETSTPVTWVWGQYFASDRVGQYAILKDSQVVWTSITSEVHDIYFLDKDRGFAVSDSGQVLKTTAGGDTGEWSESATGFNEKLNAVSFITSNFGWVAADSGIAAYTSNEGSSWIRYPQITGISLSDIFTKVTASGSISAEVHAFMVGTGGKIYKLAAPTITALNPSAKPPGWSGTVEVTGTAFMDGVTLAISGAGITLAPVTFESATRLIAFVSIEAAAASGARTLTATNPDTTASTKADAFAVATATEETSVSFSDIWLDGSSYISPEAAGAPKITVTTLPWISFEVTCFKGISREALNGRIIAKSASQTADFPIPTSAVSAESATRVKVLYQLPTALATGEVVTFTLSAESGGVIGNRDIYAIVAAVTGTVPPGTIPPTGTTAGLVATIQITKNQWDPETTTSIGATLNIQPGVEVSGVIITLFDFRGNVIYQNQFGEGTGAAYVKTQAVTPQGIVTKYNFNIRTAELATYLSAGIYTMMVHDRSTKKLIAKNKMVIAPQNMQTN